MYDGASRSELSPHQRAVGELRVALRRRGEETVLDNLRQAGCLKARFPRGADAGWRDVVLLNSSGGVAGGDRLDVSLDVQSDARATFAAQAAERFYRALPDTVPARLRTRIDVADGAIAEWLPQETILFDRCALDRRLDVHLSKTGRFLGLEMLVFGRAAMGEQVHTASVSDIIRIHRAGRIILHDAVHLHGDVGKILARPAVARGARAVATLVLVAPGAGDYLDPLRAALTECSAEAGASCWDGMLVLRALAGTGANLRQTIITALNILRPGRALPRVWMC